MTDAELLKEIRHVIATSPFVGEGTARCGTRLRRERGVCMGGKPVLRLTREAGLLAPIP